MPEHPQKPPPPSPPATEPPVATATPPEAPKPTAPKTAESREPVGLTRRLPRPRSSVSARRTRATGPTAKAQAAEDAKKELAQTIGKALGLVEDEQIDPAKLTESLTTAQSDAKHARVELAVFRNAGTAGGDPAALLDSSSFLSVARRHRPQRHRRRDGCDRVGGRGEPAARCRTRLTRTPAPNPAQGSSANGSTVPAQLTRAELAGMSPDAIEQARLDGRLNELLGTKP